MKNIKTNINIYFLIFLVLFLCLFSTIFFLNKTSNKLFLDESKTFPLNFHSVNGKSRTLNYSFPRHEDTPYYESISSFHKSELNFLNNSQKKIIIYRFTGNWYKLYINGTLIGSMGDIEEHKSDIWNNLGSFNIDDSLIQDFNEIKLISYNEYEFGLLGYPIIITSNKQAIKIENWAYLILFGINLIVMGTLGITFIILIVLSVFVDYKVHKLDFSYIFYAFSTITIAITIIDHIQMNNISLSLLNYKKMITVLYYVSPILISMALQVKFKYKSLNVISLLLACSAIYLLIIPKDVITLKTHYDRTNFLILICILNWVRITLINFKKSNPAKILFFGVFTQLLLSGYDIINFALGKPFNNFYAYGVFGLSVSIIILVIQDMVKIMGKLEFEKRRSKLLYQKSIKDGMTDIYNHQFMHKTLKETTKDYTLIIVDIDDFKQINDNFGHQAGDKVIKRVASISKNNLTLPSIVGRYGGDEFLIILFEKDETSVRQIAEKIKSEIEMPFSYEKFEIKTSISMGVFSSQSGFNYEKIMSFADKALYKAKKSGKSQIIEYINTN